jgi:hypothetical protein
MTVDTRRRRGSAAGVLPDPDGTIDAGDRAQLGRAYRGPFEPAGVNPPPIGWRVIRAGSSRATVRTGAFRARVRAR